MRYHALIALAIKCLYIYSLITNVCHIKGLLTIVVMAKLQLKKNLILKSKKVNNFMNFKTEFENDYLRLFQADNSDFEKLYSIAKDPNIWK